MRYLIIDTSDDAMSVILYDGGIYYKTTEKGAKKHNSAVIPVIDELLVSHGITVGDIDHFCAVVGPGSFTGVRIAVSVVNAFVQATGKNAVAINSLEILAYNIKSENILTAIDAGHGNYYAAEYNGDFTNCVYIGERTAEYVGSFDGEVAVKGGTLNIESAVGVAEYKIRRGEFSKELQPLYLKKSQAEREKDAGII